MNDADLGDNVDEHAGQLEDQKTGDKRFENDGAHMAPSRWWFASSAFPMIAGTLGPVASAFSICALARPWRQNVTGDIRITSAPFETDPEWLIIVNAIQLVVALISNAFLLLNMARRVRFSLAQPITILGWYFSSICLLVLAATAAGPLDNQPDKDFVWSQAFYYGIFAAILYFIVASLMVVTVFGAYTKHYAADFQLTNSQRTLMLQTVMYLFYLLVGALVFSNIEGWVYLDAVYWANTTLFTVGFGDMVPQQNVGRALLIPYALFGIITLGLLIGSIRSLILERGRRRLDARMMEKQRRKLVRTMTDKGRDDILKPILAESGAPRPSSLFHGKPVSTEYDRRRQEFLLMRKIQDHASKRRRWMAMGISMSVWLVLWLVGAKVFQECEYPYQQWTYFDGFYFAFVTLTTLGYGDRVPVSPGGRAFYVFWSLLALPTMTVLISNAGDTIILAIKNATIELGNITILPGERGFKKDMQRLLRHLTCGALYPKEDNSDDEEDGNGNEILPPGFFAAARRISAEENDSSSNGSRGSGGGSDGSDGDRPSNDNDRGQRQDPSHLQVPSRAPPPRYSDQRGRSREARPQLHPSRTSETFSTRLRRSLSAVRDPAAALPPSRADYHYLLITEITAVTLDLRRKDPRRYTFAEWAWYLKLIGEDEGSAETHRKAKPHIKYRKPINIGPGKSNPKETPNGTTPTTTGTAAVASNSTSSNHRGRHRQRTEAQSPEREEGGAGEGTDPEGDNRGDLDKFVAEGDKWSWVGSRSPLMGSLEESEWILAKLTEKLRYELEEARHRTM